MVELLEFSNLIISAIESPKVNKWTKMVLFILKNKFDWAFNFKGFTVIQSIRDIEVKF